MTWPGPPYATGTDLLVLHALRCIGFAGPGRVAAAAGLPAPDVESVHWHDALPVHEVGRGFSRADIAGL